MNARQLGRWVLDLLVALYGILAISSSSTIGLGLPENGSGNPQRRPTKTTKRRGVYSDIACTFARVGVAYDVLSDAASEKKEDRK